jgi:hypothetical protein
MMWLTLVGGLEHGSPRLPPRYGHKAKWKKVQWVILLIF